MTSSLIGVLAALGSAASWALCSVLFKRLGERLEPVGMTTVKALVSALFILPFVLLLWRDVPLSARQLGVLAASGVLGIAIGDSLFFAALGRLSPLVLSILLLVCPNLFTGLLGVLCLGEMPCWQVWVGIVAIMVAMAGLMFPIREEGGKSTAMGVAFAVVSLVCSAVSTVIMKQKWGGGSSVLESVPSMEATMFRMLFGGVPLLIWGLFSGRARTWRRELSDGRYLRGFLAAALVVTFGGFWLALAAFAQTDMVVAGALLSLEPVFVLPFMMLFGRHRTSVREIVSLVVAVAGVLAIAFFSR